MKFWRASAALGIMMLASNAMAKIDSDASGSKIAPLAKSFQPQQQVIRATEFFPHQAQEPSEGHEVVGFCSCYYEQDSQDSGEVHLPKLSALEKVAIGVAIGFSDLKNNVEHFVLHPFVPLTLSLRNFIAIFGKLPREARAAAAAAFLAGAGVVPLTVLLNSLLSSEKTQKGDLVAKAEKSGGVKKYIKKHFNLISAAILCGIHILDAKANKTSYFQDSTRFLRAAFFSVWMWACERRAEYEKAQRIIEEDAWTELETKLPGRIISKKEEDLIREEDTKARILLLEALKRKDLEDLNEKRAKFLKEENKEKSKELEILEREKKEREEKELDLRILQEIESEKNSLKEKILENEKRAKFLKGENKRLKEVLEREKKEFAEKIARIRE